jgi:tetratricopeptide (TPR) repeat protein
MKKIIPLLVAATLTTGFTWGKSSTEKCDEARNLAMGLTSVTDRGSRLEAEESVRRLCPDGAAGIFLAGYALEQSGNPDRALLSYQEALKIDPEFTPANGRIGLLLLEKGRPDEAALLLTNAVRSHHDPAYHKGLARIFSTSNLHSLAIAHYQEALKSYPADAGLLTGLARVYQQAGQTGQAEQLYRRTLALNPGNRESLLGLAAGHQAAGEYDKALELLRKAEAADPLDKEVHRLKAELYTRKGDSTNAEIESLLAGIPVPTKAPAPAGREGDTLFAAREFAKAVEAYRAESSAAPADAELKRKLARALVAAGRDDEAIAAFKEADRLQPGNQELHRSLGQLYERKGLFDEAIVEYRQTLQSGEESEVRQRLGDIYLQRGSLPQAIEQYRSLLKANPADQGLLMKLGRAQTLANNPREAIAAFREVVRLNPDALDAHRELALLYKKGNQQDEAEQAYREILRLKKDDLEIRNALTAIYVKKKSYDDLVVLLKENTTLYPQDVNHHYKLGLVYEFQKDYANATTCYQEAVKLKEDHAKSLNALGRVNMKTGNIKEAKEFLEKAKAADPNLEETTLLLSNIRDELSPDPKKYKKSKKSKKGKKGKKSTKKSKQPAKKGAAKKTPATKAAANGPKKTSGGGGDSGH